MWLFVLTIFLALSKTSILIVRNLLQNIILILLVSLQLELALRPGQVLFFLDVVKEVVSLAVALPGQLNQVLFEASVGGLAVVSVVVVHLFSLVLGVLVNGVGSLRVHETWVPSMVGV